MKTNRVTWLDMLKGIGIFFVVLGHAPIDLWLKSYIFSFHMPLFFFASGYLFDGAKYARFKDFFKRKFKTLMLPYIYFSAISIALYVFFARFGQTKSAIDFKEIFLQFIIAKRNYISFNKALWFLPALFLVCIIYYLLKKLIKDDLAIISISLFLSAIGYIYFKTLIKPKLFWTLDASFYYLAFYAAGNLIRERNEIFQKKYSVYSAYLFLTLTLIVNASLLFNFELFEQIKLYSNSLLFGFAGITTFALLSKYVLDKFGKINIFDYLGKNSLLIFVLHLPLCFPLVEKLFSTFNVHIQNANLNGLVYAALSIIILIPVIYIVNNFMPFLLGK